MQTLTSSHSELELVMLRNIQPMELEVGQMSGNCSQSKYVASTLQTVCANHCGVLVKFAEI